MKILIVTIMAVLVASGCASRKVVQERGWVGGEFARAEPRSWKTPPDDPKVIGAFPASLQPQYNRGLVVTWLSPGSPLAKAGLKESDLILAVDEAPIENVEKFREKIDATTPGTVLTLLAFRNGETNKHNLVVGRESYREERNFTMGLALSSHLEFDFWPSPDFSLAALGYEKKRDRLHLDSPQRNYIKQVTPENSGGNGISSPEGWRAWLAIFSLGAHKKIISQEPVELVAQ